MTDTIKREACDCCNKTMLIGQRFLECQICSKIIHKNCFKKSRFCRIGSNHLCKESFGTNLGNYNPFKELTRISATENQEHDDKFYSEDFLEAFGCIGKASEILENCKPYKLNSISEKFPEKSNFGTLFYNIDGNYSNFDTFSAQLSTQKVSYSAIALAETNVSKNKGDLFKLNNYAHFYNEKMEFKSKGTGVCLYIHSSFNAIVNKQLCSTTKNLESLFVTVDGGSRKVNVGVIYRPPNGDSKEFLAELRHLFSLFPKRQKSIILGDYNFDLLKKTNVNAQKFEDLFLSMGYSPLISLPTHSKDTQQRSCIDNILTDDIEHVVMSGVIDDMATHHKPIIAMFDLGETEKSAHEQKVLQYYCFSRKNCDSLVEDLESRQEEIMNIKDFDDFFELFKNSVDSHCKLERPKSSKRNPITNPWITDGIIEAITTKEQLYDDWTAAKNKSKENTPSQILHLHQKFIDYRRCLKHVIKWQKNNYTCNKIMESQGDSKKTWRVINELRGKCKKP